jgi:hypothetical protein
MTSSMRGDDNLQANFKSVKAPASEVSPMPTIGAAEKSATSAMSARSSTLHKSPRRGDGKEGPNWLKKEAAD